MTDTDILLEHLRLIEDRLDQLLNVTPAPQQGTGRVMPNPSFPCKKCGQTIVMAYSEKNNKEIVLSETEQDYGEYELVNGKARWTGIGNYTFHFRQDRSCKSPEEIEGLI